MKSRGHRVEQLAELIREELGKLLEFEVKDPRVGFTTVIFVEVSEDLRTARVSVSVPGDEQQKKESLEGLTAAQSFLRHQLGQRLGLRHTPEVLFRLDRTEKYEQDIEEMLRRARAKT